MTKEKRDLNRELREINEAKSKVLSSEIQTARKLRDQLFPKVKKVVKSTYSYHGTEYAEPRRR